MIPQLLLLTLAGQALPSTAPAPAPTPTLVTPVVQVSSTTPCGPNACFADRAGKSFTDAEVKAQFDKAIADERTFLAQLPTDKSSAACATSLSAMKAGGFFDLATILNQRCS